MRRIASLVAFIGVSTLFMGGPSARTSEGPFYYLSPLPGAELVSTQTTLIFRPTAAFRAERGGWTSGVTVTGTRSGVHDGDWVFARDSKTVIFKPHREFEPGERVRVTVGESPGGRRSTGAFTFTFTISPKAAGLEREAVTKLCDCVEPAFSGSRRGDYPVEEPQTLSRHVMPGNIELPAGFPDRTVTTLDNPSPGYIFVSSLTFGDDPPNSHYMMILDDTGAPVFFQKAAGRFTMDFKKQPDGRLSYMVWGSKYFLMDNTYTVVDSFWAQGFGTDVHDLQILPDGNALLMGVDDQKIDMSQIVTGGDPNATVFGLIIQEVDPDKNVVFQWRSWDHFDILDATQLDFTRSSIDYVHPNSIELDRDGHLLLSSRHLDEITKINRDTGDIIWRMGGKNNEFTLVGDTLWFSYQHSCRRLDSGTITLYDNGNFHDPPESRVIEYEVDEVNKTATRVWQFRNDPATLGIAMGNIQRLANGNSVIGWGSTHPGVTEVRPDGEKAFEMEFADKVFSYRAFRFEWEAVAAAPYLWAKTETETLTLHFTKFGDWNVRTYNVYRGDAPNPTELAGRTSENRFDVHCFTAGVPLYFRVTPVDEAGESPSSNEICVTPNFTDIEASATVEFHPRTLNLKSKGRWITAYLEFGGDCERSAAEVDVSSLLINDAVPADNHPATVGDADGDGKSDLMVKFDRQAVAEILDVGDGVALRVTGLVSGASFEAIDHIRVIRPGALAEDGEGDRTPQQTVLQQNRPNPFNPSTVIRYDVPAGTGRVTLRIYDTGGRLVRTLVDEDLAGPHHGEVTWDSTNARGTRVASGIYFYRLQGPGFSQTRKMVLLK